MRLLKARIRDFRCIDDSEDLNLNSVTCLVGKNESGKTAILKALHKLKPEDEASERFEPSRDYPRRRWLPGMTIPPDPPAISTEWHLEEDEIAAVEKRLGPGALKSPVVTVAKGYDNVRRFSVEVDESAVVRHFITTAGLTAEELEPVAQVRYCQLLCRAR